MSEFLFFFEVIFLKKIKLCYNTSGDIMSNIENLLIPWFKEHKRNLPWRMNPTDYQIYISEIMLQQTRVETVIPYYNRFTETLKDFNDLANVSDELLFKLWEGLGYYSRAKNMKKCAQAIVENHNGRFPNNYEDAIKLPGIGAYTAGAILSRAYNINVAAIDGNALRVLSRVNEDSSDIAKESTKKKYKEDVEKIIQNASLFNEALMDIGATICMPKIYLCNECPLNSICKAYLNNTISNYPVKLSKVKNTPYEYSVLFITDGNKYILLNKKDGVLKDLLAPILIDRFYNEADIYNYVEDELKLSPKNVFFLNNYKHIFSHQTWYMKGFLVLVNNLDNYPSYSYDDIINKISLAKAYKKIFNDIENAPF